MVLVETNKCLLTEKCAVPAVLPAQDNFLQ